MDTLERLFKLDQVILIQLTNELPLMNVINGAVRYLPDHGDNWSVSVCCVVGA